TDSGPGTAVAAYAQHETTKPVLTRVLLDDATPEAAVTTMCEQSGAAAVISAEGTFFANIARYTKDPNFDALLKGHAGDPISVTRKSAGGGVTDVDSARLTLCVAVQPDVVVTLGKVDGFKERGGAARLLSAFIPDTRGQDD